MNARLKLLHEKANVKQVKLLPTTVVGRSTECDLKIASSQVSRVHCRITVAEDAVYIEDLGSANGTFVNDQMLTPRKPTAVQPGAKITIGPAEFLVDYIAPSSNTVVVRRSDNGPKPAAEVISNDVDGGEKELIFTAMVDEPVPESEATLFGMRMENLVAEAMEAIQAEVPPKRSEPQPAPEVEVAIPLRSVNPVAVPQAAAVSLPEPVAVEPEPVPVSPPKPVIVAPAVAAQVPAAPAIAPVVAAVAPAVAPAVAVAPKPAIAVPVKPAAPAVAVVAPVAAPVAKAVAVPTARAVPVQPPAAAPLPKAEPVAPPVNPFQFGQAAPAKTAPVKPPVISPAPPAKVVLQVAAAVPLEPAPPVVAAAPVFVEPQPFGQFGEPTESNPVGDEAPAFDFAADAAPSRASKPSAKSGKPAAGGLKSLLSVFGRKSASATSKAKSPTPPPETAEDPSEAPDAPEPPPVEVVDEPAPFAFGATEPAAEVEERSHDQAAPDDDFQNFLKQF